MNKTFYKSKTKVTLLIIICISIVFFGATVTLFFILDQSLKSRIIIVLSSSIACSILIVAKAKAQYSQCLQMLPDKMIFYDSRLQTIINYREIQFIKYHGTKLIPMTEMLSISGNNRTIYIDFNFIHYKMLWNEVIQICRDNNCTIEVDEKIERMIKSTVNKI